MIDDCRLCRKNGANVTPDGAEGLLPGVPRCAAGWQRAAGGPRMMAAAPRALAAAGAAEVAPHAPAAAAAPRAPLAAAAVAGAEALGASFLREATLYMQPDGRRLTRDLSVSFDGSFNATIERGTTIAVRLG